jgi:hypothetical protein
MRVLPWAAAATVLVMGLVMMQHEEETTQSPLTDQSDQSHPSVAALSGTKDCEWSSEAMQTGASLQAGQRVSLKSGMAEITFDSGARVTVEGPASLLVASAWDASLESGAANASVPAEAEGFRLSNKSVELVNSDAELSMIANPTSTEVLVRKGSVAASSHSSVVPVVLRENDSRSFNASGISDVKDLERKRAKFARVLKFDRHISPSGYAHWAFDDTANASLTAETKGKKKAAQYLAKLMAGENAAANTSLTEGRWKKALSFDGRLFAKLSAPGMSSRDSAHTLAFWARVPEDASLAGGTAMIAWGDKKHAQLHTRISWNKKPALGPVGALRTEIGRFAATGTTNLRDGRWHHIAIVLTPGARGVLQTKQYVDGRLDGTSVTAAFRGRSESSDQNESLFLGRSPGDKGREGSFVGAMDELFVIDRALSPAEITRLMRDNEPPETTLAEAL